MWHGLGSAAQPGNNSLAWLTGPTHLGGQQLPQSGFPRRREGTDYQSLQRLLAASSQAPQPTNLAAAPQGAGNSRAFQSDPWTQSSAPLHQGGFQGQSGGGFGSAQPLLDSELLRALQTRGQNFLGQSDRGKCQAGVWVQSPQGSPELSIPLGSSPVEVGLCSKVHFQWGVEERALSTA